MSAKLPEYQQNYQILNKTPPKLLKLPEYQQNYQILNKTPMKYDENFSNYQILNKITRFSAKPPDSQQNYPKSGGHGGYSPTIIRGPWGILPHQNHGAMGEYPPPRSGGHGGISPTPTHATTLRATTRPIYERTSHRYTPTNHNHCTHTLHPHYTHTF